MQENQKFKILENIVILLNHRYPESQQQFCMLHGAIKEWADQLYQQLIQKNKIILTFANNKIILENLRNTLEELEIVIKNICNQSKDLNIEIYYRQYLTLISPIIYNFKKGAQGEDSIWNQNKLKHKYHPSSPINLKRVSLLEHNRSPSSPHKISEQPSRQESNTIQSNSSNFSNKKRINNNLSQNLFQDNYISKVMPTIQQQLKQYSDQSKHQKINSLDHNPNKQISKKKTNNSQFNEYQQCLLELRKQLLSVQKLIPDLKNKNRYLQQQLKILQGRYHQKQRQVLEYQQKLYKGQKVKNKMQIELAQLKRLKQSPQKNNNSHNQSKLTTIVKNSMIDQNYSNMHHQDSRSPLIRTQTTIKQQSSSININCKKNYHQNTEDDKWRFLLTQASAIEMFLKNIS